VQPTLGVRKSGSKLLRDGCLHTHHMGVMMRYQQVWLRLN
jgi:hypothetical protein